VSANHRYETLTEMVDGGRNVAAICDGCGHRGVVSGRKLARFFWVRRWDGRKHLIPGRLRCSRCGARPAHLWPVYAKPTGPEWGPRSEADWKRLVARVRG
jgi:hypothetical protein